MVKWSDPLSGWMIAEENFSNNENNGAVPMTYRLYREYLRVAFLFDGGSSVRRFPYIL